MAADQMNIEIKTDGDRKQNDDPVLLAFDESDLDARSSTGSEFDAALRNRWDTAMQKGFFRYTIGQLESRVVPGKHRFITKLNVLRGTKRRKPQDIATVYAPFQPDLFNFTKAHPKEVLMHLVPRHRQDGEIKNAVLINISPFEYGNVLIVPDVDGRWPQVMTDAGIRLVIEVMMLSRNRDFRAGFNSMCACASVNHQHFHAYYLDYQLRVEHVAVDRVAGQLFELSDHPARAFAFQVTQLCDIEAISRLVFNVSHFLVEKEVAHNMFLTRGRGFEASDQEVIRILLFPRVSVPGGVDGSFHIACVELAGHIPMHKEELFRHMTEDDILHVFNRYALDDGSFERLKEEFISHYLNVQP